MVECQKDGIPIVDDILLGESALIVEIEDDVDQSGTLSSLSPFAQSTPLSQSPTTEPEIDSVLANGAPTQSKNYSSYFMLYYNLT